MADEKELFSKKIGKILELCEISGIKPEISNRIRKQIWYLYDDIQDVKDGRKNGKTDAERC